MNWANRRILIIPEGFCEYLYAQAIKSSLPREKQRSVSIDIPKPQCKNKAPQLLERAKRYIRKANRENNRYNAVWLFFDNDGQENIGEVFEKAKKRDIGVAYSCISIEHWFILHLEDKKTLFSNASQAFREANKVWKKHFKKEYHKTKINHYDILKGNLNTATNRAKQIKAQSERDGIPLHSRNPYFTIHELIEFLEGL